MKRDDLLPLVFGVLISTVLAGTLVIAGLKAGITPGVSPLVILVAWGIFAKSIQAGGGTRVLNISQVAGSAGMAVTSGVIFVAPLVQILYRDKGLEAPPVDWPTLILLSVAGALVGFGFVGLATKKFLSDPSLPAPEARACEAMIEAAVEEEGKRPKLSTSLGLGLLFSFLAPLAASLGAAKEHIVLLTKRQGDREFTFDLPMTPIYIGIGGLLTLATALLVFGGSFLRLIGDYLLAGIPAGDALEATWPANSMRWVGGGAMTVAVGYSLMSFMGVKSGRESLPDPKGHLVVDRHMKTMLVLSIAVGMALFFGWLLMREGGVSVFGLSMSATILVMCTVMVTLGALLSLQIGSSASPVSGTIFVTTLVLCLVALAVGRSEIDDVLILTPLLVGACVAVCTANDSSQDYKTMQLCGIRVQEGFLAQILGLLGGCIVVPIVVWVADGAYVLGSDDLAAPQGQMFATLVNGLLLESQLPWMPILAGVAVGVAAVSMDVIGGKRGLQLPAMALAVGIYLPPYLGVGILIGAFFRWMGEGKGEQRHESILAAAGLITGAAAFELILGIFIIGGFDSSRLDVMTKDGVPFAGGSIVAGVGILLLGGLLFVNSRRSRE